MERDETGERVGVREDDPDAGRAESEGRAEPAECAESGCTASAAVRLHVPWDENREVCTAHARALAQQEGVVAEPLDASDDEWP